MVYGLVGEKLSHSYSKEIHESLGRYHYELFSLEPAALAPFIANRRYDGLNITIPYKKAVIPLCDEVSPLAEEIGAVNTLYFNEGKLCGTNTDYFGFLYAARRAGISFAGRTVLILGNGGTSLMARKAAADSGAREIFIASRRREPGCIAYDALSGLNGVEIIVNTTPVGTYPNNGQTLISLKDFPQCAGVIDVIYNPFVTDLLRQAAQLCIPHTNGLPMLAAQATAAAEYFLGESGFQDQNAAIIRQLKRNIQNVVLIGMPGCGKSALGRQLAQALGKTFVDMDAEIEALDGRTIPAIFEQDGEPFFRDLETRTALAAGKEKSQVIATGGGVVLRKENMDALRQNGITIFLKRGLENLPRDGRPLSKDKNTLKAMYETRLPLYNKYSDLTYQSSEGVENNLHKLLSLLDTKELGG